MKQNVFVNLKNYLFKEKHFEEPKDEPEWVHVESDGPKVENKSKTPIDLKNSIIKTEIKSNEIKKEVKTSDEMELFKFVLVVSLKEENSKLNPTITFSFPSISVEKKENKNILSSIPSFCYPDLENVAQENTVFNFVLTDINGQRRFGYCRRIKGKNKYPDTYCIVSSQ